MDYPKRELVPIHEVEGMLADIAEDLIIADKALASGKCDFESYQKFQDEVKVQRARIRSLLASPRCILISSN